MRLLEQMTGRRAGGSTGTNLWGSLMLIARMRAAHCPGSVVTLLCDNGDRYMHTYYNDEWLSAQGIDPGPYEAALQLMDDEDPNAFLLHCATLPR